MNSLLYFIISYESEEMKRKLITIQDQLRPKLGSATVLIVSILAQLRVPRFSEICAYKAIWSSLA